MYFNTRELAPISISAAIWAIINAIVGPVFWNLTHLPIVCDMIGVLALLFTVWFVRKLGAATMVGVVATILSLILNPAGLQFLGFTAASVVFDALSRAISYRNSLDRRVVSSFTLLAISLFSTLVAGYIIGTLFMSPVFLSSMFGGVLFFIGLHGAGGLIGGVVGVVIVRGLEVRRVKPFRNAE
jgi:hypothetical protein